MERRWKGGHLTEVLGVECPARALHLHMVQGRQWSGGCRWLCRLRTSSLMHSFITTGTQAKKNDCQGTSTVAAPCSRRNPGHWGLHGGYELQPAAGCTRCGSSPPQAARDRQPAPCAACLFDARAEGAEDAIWPQALARRGHYLQLGKVAPGALSTSCACRGKCSAPAGAGAVQMPPHGLPTPRTHMPQIRTARTFQGPGRSRNSASARPCSSSGNPSASMSRCVTVTTLSRPAGGRRAAAGALGLLPVDGRRSCMSGLDSSLALSAPRPAAPPPHQRPRVTFPS